MRAEDRLDRLLQLVEREIGRHELEDHGAIFDLGADAPDGSREDATVVEAHRGAEARQERPSEGGLASVTSRFLYETCLVKQLVAVENLLLVPGRAVEAEAHADAVLTLDGTRDRRTQDRALGPFLKARLDLGRQQLGTAFAPVLPREEVIPAAPCAALDITGTDRVGQREIADRNNMRGRVA